MTRANATISTLTNIDFISTGNSLWLTYLTRAWRYGKNLDLAAEADVCADYSLALARVAGASTRKATHPALPKISRLSASLRGKLSLF